MPELGTILGRLRERGIDSLNDMQRRMSRLKGRSALLLAPTGSGKTIAFALPLLMRLGKPGEGVRALVLAPSRELVLQIAGVIAQAARGYKTLALYGGHPFREEEASLSVAPDIVVATPGRLLDHISRSTIDLDNVATLVIDEYDKQLELGFEDEMRRICRRLKHVSTRILTSATRLGELPDWLPLSGVKPEVLDFTEGGAPAPRPTIVRVESPSRDKLDTLVDLLRARAGESAIVFVNHRESAERVKSLMFTFEDLVRVDSQGIQVLLRNVDKDKLAIALKGASETIKDLFFNNMSSRAGKIIKEDMEAMGPVRLRDVEEAQQYIVTTTKELSNAGEIVISEGKDNDELIY